MLYVPGRLYFSSKHCSTLPAWSLVMDNTWIVNEVELSALLFFLLSFCFVAETVLDYNPAKTKSLREVISLVQVGEIDIVTLYVDCNRTKWTWQNWKLEKLKDGWHEKNGKRASNTKRPEILVSDWSTKTSFTYRTFRHISHISPEMSNNVEKA